MTTGKFFGNVPYIPIMLVNGAAIQCPFFALDTGFTGDLLITSKMAKEIGVMPQGVTPIQIAGGATINLEFGTSLAMLNDEPKEIQVLIAGGMPLAGIDLFTKFGCRISVDCVNRTVEVEN